MRFLGSPDATQREVLRRLQETEDILGAACAKASGRDCSAEVVALPDLGVPHNVQRIHGGFLTGALYTWDCPVPFVPVDATVNTCGVACFQISDESPLVKDFHLRVQYAKNAWEGETSYLWNFTTGNHFVILARQEGAHSTLPAGYYLILHASPGEFKHQFSGLYPSDHNWYSHAVKTYEAKNGRYLRYVEGDVAERFFEQADWLIAYQRDRQRHFAEIAAGSEFIIREVANQSHYGMPDAQSIAIGCYWLDGTETEYILLTRPRAPIYLVESNMATTSMVTLSSGSAVSLAPHGTGVRSRRSLDMGQDANGLRIWGRSYTLTDTLRSEPELDFRPALMDTDAVASALGDCTGSVVAQLRQVHSVYRTGVH